ncbi:hypothetical protein GCM10010460_06700 [Microbacterium terrae]|uniref:Uncharacterized protein n=1 Tax=Microbacterium terrae TaxID=69369 RepID=A0A0M2H296_9MICO|nr:hypothetical protein RS81_03331 [Microbacterium terrae]GLJ97231.1 hypothetical protein GCM10017594_04280 [Microbacterium terrae]
MLPTSSRRRAALVGAITLCVALVIVAVVGVIGLTMPALETDPDPASVAAQSPEAASAPGVLTPQRVRLSSDPEASARAVAMAVLTWDTRGPADPLDWAQPLVDLADAEDATAVAADVRGYLPTTEQWHSLQMYGTRQWLTIDALAVPDAWATALEQAAPGQLPPGAVALTVTGTRHRDGIWETEHVTSARPVAFTVFLACPPAEHCRLLRLSRVDAPLR